MRGKLPFGSSQRTVSRNIPAYAGKTHHVDNGAHMLQEHPRVCGENIGRWKTGVVSAGTSPRMRGKLAWALRSANPGRNIPAYAGKTPSGTAPERPPREHPRVCGENLNFVIYITYCYGTSPRMRGKRIRLVCLVRRRGNIPAYAGKTRSTAATPYRLTEHPRVCGENQISAQPALFPFGTSPRMRGKLSQSVS